MSFTHEHIETIWDEYATENGHHRIAVCYENGQFAGLHIRGHQFDGRVTLDNLDEIQQLITALHAAVAGIHKRGSDE